MELTLPDSERVLLQQTQRACRGQAGYVPVTVLLMLDQGHATATVAQALGVDVSSVYQLCPDLPVARPGGLPVGRAVGLLGLAHQRPTRRPAPGTGPGALHRLLGHCLPIRPT